MCTCRYQTLFQYYYQFVALYSFILSVIQCTVGLYIPTRVCLYSVCVIIVNNSVVVSLAGWCVVGPVSIRLAGAGTVSHEGVATPTVVGGCAAQSDTRDVDEAILRSLQVFFTFSHYVRDQDQYIRYIVTMVTAPSLLYMAMVFHNPIRR